MVCGVKKETSYLYGAQHYAVVALHENAGVAATTPFTYSKSSTSTESLRRRGKNQQQLLFFRPSYHQQLASASLPLHSRFRSPRNQTPLPPQAPQAPRATGRTLCVCDRLCFQVPKLVERSTRVEYFLHGVRLWQRGRVFGDGVVRGSLRLKNTTAREATFN